MNHRRLFNRRQAPSTNLIRQELVEAMQEPGCALCGLAQQKSSRYVETLLETAVMDVDQRDDWRYAGGFCQLHAEMALTIPNAAGSLAILYEDVLQYEMAGLPDLEVNRSWWQRHRQGVKRRVQQWLYKRQERAGCPVCRTWQTQEHLYWAVLLDDGDQDDVMRVFIESDGLCIPHTVSLIEFGSTHIHLPAVLAAQRQCLQHLHGHVKAFIRKQDYRFVHEPYGEEADAWQRVVACLVGRWPGK
ncbi:DUF6062 family protein [Candidatus Entotheonella palauensis]|uniref:DUF6062 family protein n=1 Tax=Candidatus Entotheonella palauensis TaxID=93172 RepID=UPI000B7E8E1D|nr:DUF6062 family protein [Candidatus Entotheonella palauensis]